MMPRLASIPSHPAMHILGNELQEPGKIKRHLQRRRRLWQRRVEQRIDNCQNISRQATRRNREAAHNLNIYGAAR